MPVYLTYFTAWADDSGKIQYYNDIYGRDMKHTLDSGIIDGKNFAFIEGCLYPDGTRVIAATMAELGPNGIVRQTTVQAWDI